jgi:hypothetical protein
MDIGFAATVTAGYNRRMRETKSVRVSATMKPSVKKQLAELATAWSLSEADALAEAIKRARQAKDVREALAKAGEEGG